jgi:hypothetical protein
MFEMAFAQLKFHFVNDSLEFVLFALHPPALDYCQPKQRRPEFQPAYRRPEYVDA